MQVKEPVKTHPLQTFAELGAAPVKKVEALRTGGMDKITGAMFAQEAIALCMDHANKWTTLALKLFAMNTEQRTAGIAEWRLWKKNKTEAFNAGTEPAPRMDEKVFKRIMATATTRLGHLSTIAKAIDAGMGQEQVEAHYNCGLETLSIDTIYQLALTYSKSKAGRKADSFLVALGKFLEAKAKTGIAEDDVDTYNKVIQFVNTLAE